MIKMEVYIVYGYDDRGNAGTPIIFRAADANSADTVEALLGLLQDAGTLDNWEKTEILSI